MQRLPPLPPAAPACRCQKSSRRRDCPRCPPIRSLRASASRNSIRHDGRTLDAGDRRVQCTRSAARSCCSCSRSRSRSRLVLRNTNGFPLLVAVEAPESGGCEAIALLRWRSPDARCAGTSVPIRASERRRCERISSRSSAANTRCKRWLWCSSPATELTGLRGSTLVRFSVAMLPLGLACSRGCLCGCRTDAQVVE